MSDEPQDVTEIPHMPIAEFRAAGWIQEINRRLLHPVGLAVEVTTVDANGDTGLRDLIEDAMQDYCVRADIFTGPHQDSLLEGLAKAVADRLAPPGSERISGVWDYREDPEGIYFGGLNPNLGPRARALEDLRRERAITRRAALGWAVQPAGRESSSLPLLDVQLVRTGGLGIEENVARRDGLTDDDVREFVQLQLDTLCPVDVATITIRRRR